MREVNGVAVKVLRALGAEPLQVIRAVERAVPLGERQLAGKPALTPQTQRVIELAVDEARLRGRHYIGPEHLLLGLVRGGEGVAVNVLAALGIDLDRVRTQTEAALLQEEAQPQEQHLAWPALLEPLAVDLTAAAVAGRLDPLIGREAELERLIQILCRRTQPNPLLVGEPGVGKRALVRGLAQRMVAGRVPPPLLNRRLLLLDVNNLVPSILYRFVAEARLRQMLDVCTATRAILVIDKLPTLVAAANSQVEVANRVKLALTRGELQVIGATTPDRYGKVIGAEAARDWHLQPLLLEEPSPAETIAILQGVQSRYERHHQVVFTAEALQAAVELAVRHGPGRFLPDKALDLLDEAGSRVQMARSPSADAIQALFLGLQQVRRQKAAALENQRLEEALELRRREVELEAKLDELRTSSATDQLPVVTPADIAAVVAQWTGAPRGFPGSRLGAGAVSRLDPAEETGEPDAGEGDSGADTPSQ
jgi:ATP-dependent Clp protease ATP-binding subunit ClpC